MEWWPWVLVGIFLMNAGVCAVPWNSPGAAAREGGIGAVFATLAALGIIAVRIAMGSGVAWFVAIASLFIASLSLLIQAFSARQLRSDPRQRWFICWINVLTAGSLGVVVAPTIVWFALGWTTVGAALILLLAMYPQLRQARQGVRRTLANDGLGVASLWGAVVVLMVVHGGDVRWSQLAGVTAQLGALQLVTVALLLTIAALARSAQAPFHTWLPVTLAAPTPVSAIMHAGVVNASVFLFIRFSDVVSASQAAMVTIFVAGSLTMVIGAAGYILRPDLKGRLVASTTAQMGFLAVTLGVGAYAAALFHLMGHGLYKSNLFLRSGSQVTDLRRKGDYPRKQSSPLAQRITAAVFALVIPSAAIFATTLVLDRQPSSSALIISAYGSITGGILLYRWLASTSIAMFTRILSVPAVAVAGIGFAFVVRGFDLLISPEVPSPVWVTPGVALVIPLVLVATISLLPALSAKRSAVLYGFVTALAATDIVRSRVPHSSLPPRPLVPQLVQETP